MAYCQGCGSYVGDYSFFRHKIPGKSEMVLCYRCKHWADRHPGQDKFPVKAASSFENSRIRSFSLIYVISAFGMFAAGVLMVLSGARPAIGLLVLIGAISLFLVGRGMRKYFKSNQSKDIR